MADDAGEYTPLVLAELDAMIRSALPRWSLAPDSSIELLNVSENATYRVNDAATGRPVILRIHRHAYHEPDEIGAELAWIDALRLGNVVDTPEPLPARDGELVQTLPAVSQSPARHAVAFGLVPGREPAQDENLVAWFEVLGRLNGRMHDHARRWRRPAGFRRKRWDFETMLGARPLWGRWEAGLGLDHAGRDHLARVVALIRRRLEGYGNGPARFGLIHADLRLANLLVDGAQLTVIDFDDCGFSWFIYDFAAAVSFLEHEPIIPALAEAWTRGYRMSSELAAEDAAMMPVFVMLRRVLLTAWIASHAETPLARDMGVPYTTGTLVLGEDFLTHHG